MCPACVVVTGQLGGRFRGSNSGLVASLYLGCLPGLRGGFKEENLFKVRGTRARKTQECPTGTPTSMVMLSWLEYKRDQVPESAGWWSQGLAELSLKSRRPAAGSRSVHLLPQPHTGRLGLRGSEGAATAGSRSVDLLPQPHTGRRGLRGI